MKAFTLHIGLPKTGTTTIQKYYFSLLGDKSICYNPNTIIGPLIEAIKLLDFDLLREEDEHLLKKIIQVECDKIIQKNILISLEHLSQRLMKIDFQKRSRFINAIFPNATVVLVLRHQPKLLKSLYLQHLSQNYLLKPEEVFIPFAKPIFSKNQQWKNCLLINVKDWNYKEAVSSFKNLFGDRFYVLFYENHKENILEIGKLVMKYANLKPKNKTPIQNFKNVPYTNVSSHKLKVDILLKFRKAFRSHFSFNNRHVQDLDDQVKQSRYLFNSSRGHDFEERLKGSRRTSRHYFYYLDQRLLTMVKYCIDSFVVLKYRKKYELPPIINSYLEDESKVLNDSLSDVIDKRKIPIEYL